jgi:tRNA G18 (ribose-2'-O)-methylase SpoU
LACFKRKELLSVDEALSGATTVAVIEGVNTPTNLGVILRCAIALGVDAYLLDPTCCDPLYRRCGRVSMGEAFATPYARLAPFPDGLAPLRDANFELLALTPAADSVPIGDLSFGADDRVALLLGAEGPGLTEATMMACDKRVKIPMSGLTDSINVGSAAAVAFYAVGQARKP